MKTSLALILAVVALPAWAQDAPPPADSSLPGDGFKASRYDTLWTKSPFAVATPDAVDTSPDYNLVGITVLEGISYASIVDAHTGDHFIISSDKDTKGLKLSTINHGPDGKETFATVLKDGAPLTLKLATQPVAVTGVPGAEVPPNAPMGMAPPPPPVAQNIPMPGSNNPPPSAQGLPPSVRPYTRLHRSPIHLPPVPAPANNTAPPPAQQAQPNGGNPTGAPLQPHVVPPQ